MSDLPLEVIRALVLEASLLGRDVPMITSRGEALSISRRPLGIFVSLSLFTLDRRYDTDMKVGLVVELTGDRGLLGLLDL